MTVSLSSAGGSGGGGDDSNNGNGNGLNGKGNGSGTGGNGNGNNAAGDKEANNGGGRRVLVAKSDSAHNVNININGTNNNNMNDEGLYVPRTGIVKVVVRPPPPVRSVRRALFGRHDVEESRAWLERQLLAIKEANEKKWNFDFANTRPMESRPSDRYTWERVVQPVRRVAEVAGVAAAEMQGDSSQEDSGPEDSGLEDSSQEDSSQEESVGQEEGSSQAGSSGGRTGAGAKQQKQTKVTDYMGKTKKRPSAVPGKEDEAAATNKRGRHSVPTTMTTI